MINKINFTGRAYFLNNVDKNISPAHKTRIENYANKLDETTDVVVIGQAHKQYFIYKGHAYSQDQVSVNIKDDNISIQIPTQKGMKNIPIDEIEMQKIPVPIYNAYILEDYNKENLELIPYKKQFDFTNETKNVLIKPNNGLEKDSINY